MNDQECCHRPQQFYTDDTLSTMKVCRWPQHIAMSIAGEIHDGVSDMLSQSRLMRQTNGIQLMRRDDFALLDLIGEGAFSQVRRVVTRNGQHYACKQLKLSLMSRPDSFKTAATELAYEAHMLSSFDHPHILKIRGWTWNGISSFEDGRHDSFFLLLDILDETLEQRIEHWIHQDQQLRISSQQIMYKNNVLQHQYREKLQALTDIALALDYIHKRGVIFRDLKPANIGFKNNRVQLFDFGLSRELPTLDTSVPFEMSGKVGTIRYMAPEVVLHLPYTISADVYSWSMVAYEMLSLDKPYDGWSPAMHEDFVCNKGIRPDVFQCRQSIPMEMVLLLQNAWDGLPQRRPTFCQISMQLNLLQEKERLLLRREELSRQLIGLNHAQQEPSSVTFDFLNTFSIPSKNTQRYHGSNDSLGTIETDSLSSKSWYDLEI